MFTDDCVSWEAAENFYSSDRYPRYVMLEDGSYRRLRRGGTESRDYVRVTEAHIKQTNIENLSKIGGK